MHESHWDSEYTILWWSCLTDLSVRVQSAARGAVCSVFAGSLGLIGTYLRKTEFDVARPSTIKSPARSKTNSTHLLPTPLCHLPPYAFLYYFKPLKHMFIAYITTQTYSFSNLIPLLTRLYPKHHFHFAKSEILKIYTFLISKLPSSLVLTKFSQLTHAIVLFSLPQFHKNLLRILVIVWHTNLGALKNEGEQ